MTKQLERKAKGGSLLSAFELYQQEKNKNLHDLNNKSDQWFEFCWNYLQQPAHDGSLDIYHPEHPFCLRSMSFTDFRRFPQLDINFEEDLTIIIGNNGQGKTSILYAIAKTLSWFTANILKEDSSGQRLNEYSDIRNNSDNNFSDISSNFFFGKGLKNISIRLSRSTLGAAERRESIIKPAKEVADIWRIINERRVINLPIFAFYSVERSHPFSKPAKESIEKREDRFDAYNHALTGAGRFDHFAEWFIYLHKRAQAQGVSAIELLEEQVNNLKQSVENGLTSMVPLLEETQKKLLTAQIRKEALQSVSMLTETAQMDIVSRAITTVVPSISRIWVETASGADIIKVTNDSQDVSIEQLSDGQRVFLALVADLARRMIMLNPLLKNPLEGRGIVLIDEIELHLHPRWQQEVIIVLRTVFPNIQFVITTHSPIVLSTTEIRCIREFKQNSESGELFLDSPPIQTKGSENSEILEQVMGVLSTPPNIAESYLVSNFEKSIIDESDDLSAESRQLYDKIVSHFGQHSSELKKADSLIRLHRMKNKISKAKREKDN
ncbi:TPA: retron Ec78 anti-phage system effector ATPase PtuA [Citrobacter freundii]|uniref:retron Ec78 anti-phage system effector ATPase PtuA n=1 Tax=Citrobacter freundii TaxID=546 RepID=UPI0015EC126E|nr:retron Ec78 anti-phage system effector ATPase PtuA [Citrobacter freundii]EKT9243981.1 AAA family ATPase [Citrobacter freundii]EKW8511032.1 AAA family ATPase [Citrobacter freundii]EMB4321036.1 AAA family ATPase [Citrobacter freundii]MDN4239123.1 AAA family ATPase [Citrobacter freundii]MDN4319337.1 AAA family ATPase [Citrobacter freundii]